MPTYLLHGFRWQRTNIRIHIIMQNLEDAAPDWIMAPASSITILNSFYTLFDFLPPSQHPLGKIDTKKSLGTSAENGNGNEEGRKSDGGDKVGRRTLTKRNKGSRASLGRLGRAGMNGHGGGTHKEEGRRASVGADVLLANQKVIEEKEKNEAQAQKPKEKEPKFNEWSVVKLVEQYDPSDLVTTNQPYAYVADYMVEVKLGVGIAEEMVRYEKKIREEEGWVGFGAGSGGESSSPGEGGLSRSELRRKSRRVGWFDRLRDGLERNEEIGWFVVVCGDEERSFGLEGEVEEAVEAPAVKSPKSAGLRGFFGRRKEKSTF